MQVEVGLEFRDHVAGGISKSFLRTALLLGPVRSCTQSRRNRQQSRQGGKHDFCNCRLADMNVECRCIAPSKCQYTSSTRHVSCLASG